MDQLVEIKEAVKAFLPADWNIDERTPLDSVNCLMREISRLRMAMAPPMAMKIFRARVGLTSTTTWRWRKAGILVTHTVGGQEFISAAEIFRFNQRAEAGEFALEHKVPNPPKRRKAL